ncbi:hypothetical protein [Candidatus Kuenenia sp.]|uniref:hypothetical protein n=1 Tax=Candidatus Kuenenia sp. TaxID=2499824 RepID=UPI0032205583
MFSKISRYRKLPDVVTTDNKGRASASRDLRLLPEVSGAFLHTVEAVDRLDHLAYKYYKQPRKWWRICDANPEFMSPQALLGKEPIVTDRFPLTFQGNGAQPPWAGLLRDLSETLGVEDVKVVENIQLVPEEQTLDGQQVTVHVEHFERAVIVTYNRMNMCVEDLASIITDTGFGVSQPENIGRVGKKIIIPPDVVG